MTDRIDQGLYNAALLQGWLTAQVIATDTTDYAGMRDLAERALEQGPLFDPTAWIKANKRLEADRDMFDALAAAHVACAKALHARLVAEGKAPRVVMAPAVDPGFAIDKPLANDQ